MRGPTITGIMYLSNGDYRMSKWSVRFIFACLSWAFKALVRAQAQLEEEAERSDEQAAYLRKKAELSRVEAQTVSLASRQLRGFVKK